MGPQNMLETVEGIEGLSGVLYRREDGRISADALWMMIGSSGTRSGTDALNLSELCAKGWKKVEMTEWRHHAITQQR